MHPIALILHTAVKQKAVIISWEKENKCEDELWSQTNSCNNEFYVFLLKFSALLYTPSSFTDIHPHCFTSNLVIVKQPWIIWVNGMNECAKNYNLSWPIDASWQHRPGSTLAQVMSCCLRAPNYYLDQCWLIIKGIHLRPIPVEVVMN